VIFKFCEKFNEKNEMNKKKKPTTQHNDNKIFSSLKKYERKGMGIVCVYNREKKKKKEEKCCSRM